MTRHKPALAIAAILLAAIFWGSTGTLQAQLPADRVPVVVGVLRLVIGAGALSVFALLGGARPDHLRGLPWRTVLAAGAAIGLYNLLFFRGVALAGVGVGTAITIGSAPIWVLGYEITVKRLRPPAAKAGGLALCLVGVVLLTGVLGGARPHPVGIVLGLGAGACYALYSQLSSTIPAGFNSLVIAATTFCAAALVTLPVLAVMPTAWIWQPGASLPLLALGVLSTAVAYALYTWGLRRTLPSTAVTLALAEPLTAFAFALFLLGEALTAASAAGAALLLIGLFLVTRGAR